MTNTTNHQTEHLVLGFGKAGKTLAKTLATQGKSVILVEQSAQMYGGTCINIGCIPTKTLKFLAEDGTPFEQAIAQKNGLIAKLNQANFEMIDKVATVITGKADFVDTHTVRVVADDGVHKIRAEHIYINTGAVSNIPPIKGIDTAPNIYDSTGIMQLPKQPQQLVIVGAGYIGLEFASLFASFGTQVTVLEMGAEFAPREDRQIAQTWQEILEQQSIVFKFNQKIEELAASDNKTVIKTAEGELTADAVLIASGRVANTDFSPQNAGIALNERGFVVVNEHLQTSQPHIYAMGDVAGSPQFTYMSLDDFRVVKSHLLGDGSHTTQNRSFPYSVFTNPPLSVAGMTAQTAQNKGLNVKTATLSANAIPKAKIMGQTDGLLKAVIDADSRQILGVQLLCAESHEMINFMHLAIEQELSCDDIAKHIFTHPTMSESLNDLFGQF